MGKSAGAALPGRGPGLAVWAAVALAAGLGAAQAGAETAAQLDAASQATDKAPAGIALARRQIASDELLDAMATLERVMMNNPANLEARALHAGLLCRIDDRRGAPRRAWRKAGRGRGIDAGGAVQRSANLCK